MSPGQGSWSRDERNAIDAKPHAFQTGGIVAGRGKIPRNASLAIQSTTVQCLNQSSPDLVNTTVAATLSDKSATRFQRPIHSSKHHICTLNPVQYGITKHGIEFFVVWQLFSANRMRVQAETPGGLNLRNTGIDRNHVAPKIHELFREYAVSATKVQDPLAGLRCKQLHDGRS
jgi:hypothetical protein